MRIGTTEGLLVEVEYDKIPGDGETKTVYTRVLEFCDGETEEGAGFPDVSTGDFPELFEDRCIEDNYTDIVAIEPVGEDE